MSWKRNESFVGVPDSREAEDREDYDHDEDRVISEEWEDIQMSEDDERIGRKEVVGLQGNEKAEMVTIMIQDYEERNPRRSR